MAAYIAPSTWEPLQPSFDYKNRPDFGQAPAKQNEFLKLLGLPAIGSFNFMLNGGLQKAVNDIQPLEFCLPSGDKIKIKIINADIQRPCLPEGVQARQKLVFPKECRMRAATYKGKLNILVGWSVNGEQRRPLPKFLGEIPIMLGSEACNLNGNSPKEMVEQGEHEQEWGGYFVVKGHEKILRMISAIRKNYPLTVKRESWKRRGKLFTDMGVFIRCVKEDMSSTNNVLHYLQNGSVKFMCSHKKALFFLPIVLILKALTNRPDSYIYQQLTLGMDDDLYVKDRVAFMMRQLQAEGLYTQEQVRRYIGKNFRAKLTELPDWYTDEEVCQYFLRISVAIHLETDVDKFHLLTFMSRKMFAFAHGKCVAEGMDDVMMQEISLAGHIYMQLLKDRITQWLTGLKYAILKKARFSKKPLELTGGEMGSIIQTFAKLDNVFESFLATGNLPSFADVGLMQDTGLSVMAENINRMRYMSHFRAVHRGAAFLGSRSSDVRQLKPDSWGFVCPVNTPDGSPCGLLNHLSATCQVINSSPDVSKLPEILFQLGMVFIEDCETVAPASCMYVIFLEGRLLGMVPDQSASRLVDKLRMLKVGTDNRVPNTLEIAFVPRIKNGQYPGIFLFSRPARMMRPVYNLAARAVELIGTFEQIYLNICVTREEALEGITTHHELDEGGFLSNLAKLIPLPDFNQSPRNMYQCQMSKQTMGTPCLNWRFQAANKLFRIQTPTSPLFRPAHWDGINMDDFATGTNAIVAVISYTGYDMEDAMVINQASLQRGLASGQVYKSEFVDLSIVFKLEPSKKVFFERDPRIEGKRLVDFLDSDGLPFVGRRVEPKEPFYCYKIEDENKYVVVAYKGEETVYVDNVKVCGNDNGTGQFNKINITYRIPRNPQIGDKFASRAGQKGINSQQWPHEDLPFTESGLVPDIIFNPHGFPSRMTIAMMIEIMAGKSASVHGLVHDATPFRFSEENTGIGYHGKLLEEAGYNYHGKERIYSGTDGREMEADIFFGVVYYQRLRHMVSDKFQVRRMGPLDVVTRQPVKGRKRGGGVRFGEMERDGLISHGSLYLLYDRLFECSDRSTMEICKKCGSYVPPLYDFPTYGQKSRRSSEILKPIRRCQMCPDGGLIDEMYVPSVYKFLIAELGSVNLRIKVQSAHI